MVRPLPIIFGQRDYLQRLGSSAGTIAEYGCYVTSFAILARACGKETDPVELNRVLTERDMYLNGNLMYDNNLTKIFPDLVYQQTIEFKNANKNTPADLSLLRELMKDPTTWVIVKIQVPPPFNTHFALVTGINGVVTIADPLTKRHEDFAQRYGDPAANIMKFVVYKGTPVSSEQVSETVRNERDINWNMVNEILAPMGIVADSNDKPGTVVRAKEKIDGYLTTISSYTKRIEELLGKYDTEQKLVISLQNDLSKILNQDKNFGQEALDAQHQASALKEGIEKIGEKLELQYDPNDDKKLVDKILAEINHLRTVEEREQNPATDVLIQLLEIFEGMGINEFAKNAGLPVVTTDDISDETVLTVKAYLKKIVEEYLALEKPSAPVLSDAPFQERQHIVTRFVKKLLGAFFEL